MAPVLTASETRTATERRYDVDALRVIAALLLLFYHSSRAFDLEPWHIKNDQLSVVIEALGDVVSAWRLPLLFLISGVGTFFALGFRSGRRYAADRFTRLFVPLVFGILVVVPPQLYVERISTWVTKRQSPIDFQGSFFEFYPHFFEGAYPKGNFSWHHLWFLVYLFIFSLAALPLFLWLRTEQGQQLIRRLATFFERGATIFLFALPLVVIEIALRGRFPSFQNFVTDWANNVHYLTLFVVGYLLAADPRFWRALERNRRLALGLAIGITAPRLLLELSLGLPRVAPYSLEYGVWMTLRAGNEWFWLVALLGYGYRYLNRPSPALRYASGIVYPFYIWHQTVIVVLAYFVVQWDAGLITKYLVLSASSLTLTVLLCELVKLTPVTRVLFGMKSRPS